MITSDPQVAGTTAPISTPAPSTFSLPACWATSSSLRTMWRSAALHTSASSSPGSGRRTTGLPRDSRTDCLDKVMLYSGTGWEIAYGHGCDQYKLACIDGVILEVSVLSGQHMNHPAMQASGWTWSRTAATPSALGLSCRRAPLMPNGPGWSL